MSFNTFGKIFRFTTWGESHGPAIGCIVDGCPPNIPISEKEIQKDMDKRRPGQSKFSTQRKESDKISILSGVSSVWIAPVLSFPCSSAQSCPGNLLIRFPCPQRLLID